MQSLPVTPISPPLFLDACMDIFTKSSFQTLPTFTSALASIDCFPYFLNWMVRLIDFSLFGHLVALSSSTGLLLHYLSAGYHRQVFPTWIFLPACHHAFLSICCLSIGSSVITSFSEVLPSFAMLLFWPYCRGFFLFSSFFDWFSLPFQKVPSHKSDAFIPFFDLSFWSGNFWTSLLLIFDSIKFFLLVLIFQRFDLCDSFLFSFFSFAFQIIKTNLYLLLWSLQKLWY